MKSDAGTPFDDVAAGQWYAQAIAAAAEAGIVNGIDAANFAPDAEIKRQEMAAMIVRAYEYATGSKVNADTSPLL